MTERKSYPIFLGVSAAHLLVIAAFIYRPGLIQPPVQLPDMQGVLVSSAESAPPVELAAPALAAPKPSTAVPPRAVAASAPVPPVVAPPSEHALTATPAPPAQSAPVPASPPQPVETRPAPNAPQSALPAPREAAAAPKTRPAQDAGNGPVTLPQADAAFLNNPKPRYPALSRRLGERGKVLLEVLILTDGSVGEIAVKTSSGFPRLDSAALEAVRRWRFQPARRGTTPIAFRYDLTIDFTIGG